MAEPFVVRGESVGVPWIASAMAAGIGLALVATWGFVGGSSRGEPRRADPRTSESLRTESLLTEVVLTEVRAPTAGPEESERPALEPLRRDACPPTLVVSFAPGAHEPDSEGRDASRRFARHASGAERVVVRGHADASGNALENLRLSHRRARRVAELLAWHGVAEERIIVQAFGEYQPGLDTPTLRRVEVVAQCGGTP